jgi:hypothetical protein
LPNNQQFHTEPPSSFSGLAVQVWLEKFAEALELRCTKDEVQQQLLDGCKVALARAESLARTEATNAAGQAAGAAVEQVSSRISTLETRVQQLVELEGENHNPLGGEQNSSRCSGGIGVGSIRVARKGGALGGNCSSIGGGHGWGVKEWAELQRAVAGKVDKGMWEQQLVGLRQQLTGLASRQEVAAELAKKLDISSYLAATAGRVLG